MQETLSLREKIKKYKKENRTYFLAQEKTTKKLEQELLKKGNYTRLWWNRTSYFLPQQKSSEVDDFLSDLGGRNCDAFSVSSLSKRDIWVLFIYYLICIGIRIYSQWGLLHDLYSVENSIGILLYRVSFEALLVLICFLFLGFFLFAVVFILFCFFDVILIFVYLISSNKKRQYLDEKFSDENCGVVVMKIWCWIFKFILSVLSFSYLGKLFSSFKGASGSFGGGGASGRW